jgi:D-glycero-D-manno-heptose 1,7-bisphosphate phosphatase
MGVHPVRPAVFLDRDGVLIDTHVVDGVTRPPADVGQMRVLPGVEDALNRLRGAGFALVVVTNQPDVRRGLQQRDRIVAINDALQARFGFDAVQVCFHDTADGCACRKPKPGLLLDAARALGLALPGSYMVGDRATDVEAGRRAGCRTVFVTHAGPPTTDADFTADNLLAATEWILADRARTTSNRTA